MPIRDFRGKTVVVAIVRCSDGDPRFPKVPF